MPDCGLPRRIFNYRPRGKWDLGRPGMRWVDSLCNFGTGLMDLKLVRRKKTVVFICYIYTIRQQSITYSTSRKGIHVGAGCGSERRG
jgi:hypothetical protein